MSPSSSDRCVAAVDIGATNLRLALARVDDSHPAGSIVARSSTSVVGVREPGKIIDVIRTGLDDLLAQAAIPRSALKAIAAGAPGIVNVDTGVVVVTSYLLGWRDVPLRALLQDSLGIPAAVDNDVKLAALGESWAGAAMGTPDFVFIAIGTGVGAGIVLGGRLFRGAGWTAGEVGYMLVPGLPGDPAPRGKPGALEGVLGGEGIRSQWHSRWSDTATSLPRDLHATEIFDHALSGDALARTILAQSARMLASAIYNMSLVLDCSLFVLGGGVGTHSALRESAQSLLTHWGTRVQPHLIASALGADAQLFGAVRLALNTADHGTQPPAASA
jgi:glucokinase